ncbi:MAG: metal-sulfur cluster assembly factor [Chloroflexota bacterium]
MDDVLEALKCVIDPELGINIVDLGLVYDVQIDEKHIQVSMTMTTPACPLSAALTAEAETVLRQRFPDYTVAKVELVWEPRWHPLMMAWEVRERLGWA